MDDEGERIQILQSDALVRELATNVLDGEQLDASVSVELSGGAVLAHRQDGMIGKYIRAGRSAQALNRLKLQLKLPVLIDIAVRYSRGELELSDGQVKVLMFMIETGGMTVKDAEETRTVGVGIEAILEQVNRITIKGRNG